MIDPSDGKVAAASPESLPNPQRFCLTCNEALLSHENACANCGQAFDAARLETFAGAPRFLAWKFWMPGFFLAVAAGVLSYAIVLKTGEMGSALFVAVPLSFGTILGFACRTRLWWILVLLGIAVPCIALSIVWFSLAGFFCGGMLSIIFIGPASLGVFLGMLLRFALKSSGWSQRWFLPLVALAAIPYVAELIENGLPRERQFTTVATSLTIDATPAEAWQALMTYEEVEHDPPLLLKLALPKPVRSVGKKSHVGDTVQCIYDRGRLCKRITEVVPRQRLAFEITEQRLAFVDVKLLGGMFEFTPVGSGTTITLSTRYEQVLRPAMIWAPTEERVIHTLHQHVMEGMRRKAIRNREELKKYQLPPRRKLAAASEPPRGRSPARH